MMMYSKLNTLMEYPSWKSSKTVKIIGMLFKIHTITAEFTYKQKCDSLDQLPDIRY
eukprot:NODE_2514_length_913_cov_63.879630_g2064_i0.p2 GENE.NODE_2514_length_913_cov_63.879630_g2064_i0~~NODE_2514_length_913_cov_63.879630_g2064_i0.p2  ORF type:complete len:56 (+),score=1.83 NODE_2514_length_913_cov_63.879630_g2064_i0:559-726(+)